MDENINNKLNISKVLDSKGKNKTFWLLLLKDIRSEKDNLNYNIVSKLNQCIIENDNLELAIDVIDFIIDYGSYNIIKLIEKKEFLDNFNFVLKKNIKVDNKTRKLVLFLIRKWGIKYKENKSLINFKYDYEYMLTKFKDFPSYDEKKYQTYLKYIQKNEIKYFIENMNNINYSITDKSIFQNPYAEELNLENSHRNNNNNKSEVEFRDQDAPPSYWEVTNSNNINSSDNNEKNKDNQKNDKKNEDNLEKDSNINKEEKKEKKEKIFRSPGEDGNEDNKNKVVSKSTHKNKDKKKEVIFKSPEGDEEEDEIKKQRLKIGNKNIRIININDKNLKNRKNFFSEEKINPHKQIIQNYNQNINNNQMNNYNNINNNQNYNRNNINRQFNNQNNNFNNQFNNNQNKNNFVNNNYNNNNFVNNNNQNNNFNNNNIQINNYVNNNQNNNINFYNQNPNNFNVNLQNNNNQNFNKANNYNPNNNYYNQNNNYNNNNNYNQNNNQNNYDFNNNNNFRHNNYNQNNYNNMGRNQNYNMNQNNIQCQNFQDYYTNRNNMNNMNNNRFSNKNYNNINLNINSYKSNIVNKLNQYNKIIDQGKYNFYNTYKKDLKNGLDEIKREIPECYRLMNYYQQNNDLYKYEIIKNLKQDIEQTLSRYEDLMNDKFPPKFVSSFGK